MKITPTSRPAGQGFTLMEILVVVAIITVLAAILFPVIGRVRSNSYRGEAINRLKSLASATATYAAQNGGELPAEDASGKDTWDATANTAGEKAWYNSLPRLLQRKGVGDFVKEGRTAAFYTNEFLGYLPGAAYPESKKLVKPYFAVAINTKLQRKDKDGVKGPVRFNNIVQPGRTVLFLERGLPGEPQAHDTISTKKEYDGSCKASGKAFVARYSSRGLLAFADGHCDQFLAKDLLTITGDLVWDSTSAGGAGLIAIWTVDPKEDPNAKPQ